MRSMCAVVPVYFEGVNSMGFHLAGVLHPGLRTANLAREFHRVSGQTLRVRIGTPIPPDVLSGYRDPARATAYLRSRTFFLSNRYAVEPGRPNIAPLERARTEPRCA